MTHSEACEQLMAAAKSFTAGDLNREEWNEEVDRILLTRYPGDPALLRRLDRGRVEQILAPRTNTTIGIPPLAAA